MLYRILKKNYLKDDEATKFNVELLGGLTVNPYVYKPKARTVRKVAQLNVQQEPEGIVLTGSVDVEREIKDKKSLRVCSKVGCECIEKSTSG
ncbi:hypothetical protein [Vibrio maritimus]|uniref:hypothetical protein n=1 Tax=Vibrio maritimus TaxID=990268 RepID=UPI0037360706